MRLTEDDKVELALALHLLKDFKRHLGADQAHTLRQVLAYARMLGVNTQFDEMFSKLPPVEITIRGS